MPSPSGCSPAPFEHPRCHAHRPAADRCIERIPLWQVYDPGTLDGRWDLLPGLDIVIAATPDDLTAPERLTLWMTTSNDYLYLDGQPSTPTDWLILGQPLSTLIAALHGRRW